MPGVCIIYLGKILCLSHHIGEDAQACRGGPTSASTPLLPTTWVVEDITIAKVEDTLE